MITRRMIVVAACFMTTACTLLGSATDSNAGKHRYVFGGGPAGGTFQVVANVIQTYKPVKDLDFQVQAQSSAGSIEKKCGVLDWQSVVLFSELLNLFLGYGT